MEKITELFYEIVVEVDHDNVLNICDNGVVAAVEAKAMATVVEAAPEEASGAAPDVKGGGWEVIGVDGSNKDSNADAWGGKPWLQLFCVL